jgi:hypothetical protein
MTVLSVPVTVFPIPPMRFLVPVTIFRLDLARGVMEAMDRRGSREMRMEAIGVKMKRKNIEYFDKWKINIFLENIKNE